MCGAQRGRIVGVRSSKGEDRGCKELKGGGTRVLGAQRERIEKVKSSKGRMEGVSSSKGEDKGSKELKRGG